MSELDLDAIQQRAEAWVRDYDDVTVEREAGTIVVALVARVRELEAQEEENGLVIAKGHELVLQAEAERDALREVLHSLPHGVLQRKRLPKQGAGE